MSLDSPQCPASNPGRMPVAETLHLPSLRDMPGGRDMFGYVRKGDRCWMNTMFNYESGVYSMRKIFNFAHLPLQSRIICSL